MTEETFEQELARRAETVHGAALSFEDVRGKAVSIRRRRRAALAGGVAAAVALVVLVPTVLGGGSPSSREPEPAPAPARTAVLHDGTVTLSDGAEVAIEVDNEDVAQYGVLTDGRIVVASSSPSRIAVYGADGALLREYPVVSNQITMSAADDAVAWVGGPDDSDRGVRILSSGQAEPRVLPGIPAAGESTGSVDAVLGPDRVLGEGGNGTDTLLTPEGPEPTGLEELVTVDDVSPDGRLWAVHYPDEADPQFGCSGLYDPEADAMVAESCETAELRFSPDGQHVLGLRGDNNMYGEATVFDLDLEPVWQWASESGDQGDVISRAAWADSERLLLARTNWREPAWSLERVDIETGEIETIVPEEPGRNPDMVAEFLFSE